MQQHQLCSKATHIHAHITEFVAHSCLRESAQVTLQFGSPDWSLRPLPHSAPPHRGGCCLQPLWPSRPSSNRPMNLPGMCLPPGCMLPAGCKHKLSDRMLQRARCEPCSSVDWTRSMQQGGCCQIMQRLGQAGACLLSVIYQTQAVR